MKGDLSMVSTCVFVEKWIENVENHMEKREIPVDKKYFFVEKDEENVTNR